MVTIPGGKEVPGPAGVRGPLGRRPSAGQLLPGATGTGEEPTLSRKDGHLSLCADAHTAWPAPVYPVGQLADPHEHFLYFVCILSVVCRQAVLSLGEHVRFQEWGGKHFSGIRYLAGISLV